MKKIILLITVLVLLLLSFGSYYFIKWHETQVLNQAISEVRSLAQIGNFERALTICDRMSTIRALTKDTCYFTYLGLKLTDLKVYLQNATLEEQLLVHKNIKIATVEVCKKVASKDSLDVCSNILLQLHLQEEMSGKLKNNTDGTS